MELQNRYETIRIELERAPFNAESLILLKSHFREKIHSERRYERCNTIQKLIRLLEKRDCLNPENIGCFQYMARILSRRNVITLINNYGDDSSMRDVALAQFPSDTPQNGFLLTHHPPPVLQDLELDPVARVDNLICSEIGQKWKDFARALGIREGRIDELENRHPSISERVREMLRFNRQNAGPQQWRVRLYSALETARRRDLRDEVQSIFVNHQLI